jgi:hypothetical protein
MCVRAVFKISEHALVDHSTGSPDMSSMLILLSVRDLAAHSRAQRCLACVA